MRKVFVFLLYILHENTFQVGQRSKLFFLSYGSLRKSTKNAYNLCIEFSSKMENLKAIKKKRLVGVTMLKLYISVEGSPPKLRQVADQKIFQYI